MTAKIPTATTTLLAIVLMTCPASIAASSASDLLERAIFTEETAGNLDAAIELYQQVVSDTDAQRPLIAQALYRLGECYRKKGDNQRAAEAYRRILRHYGDQKQPRSLAEAQLEKVAPQAKTTRLNFGPVIERVVHSVDETRTDSVIDLDVDRLFTIPKHLAHRDAEEQLDAWVQANGIDATARISAADDKVLDGRLKGLNMVSVRTTNEQWWSATVEEAEQTINQTEKEHRDTPDKNRSGSMKVEKVLPTTYFFKTREEGIGVLQILGFTHEPQGVKFRYKMGVRDARAGVEEFLAAALAGRREAAAKLLGPRYGNSRHALDDLQQLGGTAEMKVVSVHAGDDDALALTTNVSGDHGRKGPLVITLVKQRGLWVVNDIDLKAPAEARGRLERYLQRRPNATPVAATTQTNRPPTASEADKRSAESLSARAWGLWRRQRFAEAEPLFKLAVRRDPTAANAWNGLGWSQFNQRKPLNAKVSFEKCLAIDPKHAAALNGLGWIAKGQGKTDEAIGHWQKAVDAAPGATAALNGLSTTYMDLGQYDKAANIFETWLEAEPNNAMVKSGREKAKRAGTAVRSAVKAAEKWLELLDDGEYGKGWDDSSALLRAAVTKNRWIVSLTPISAGGKPTDILS